MPYMQIAFGNPASCKVVFGNSNSMEEVPGKLEKGPWEEACKRIQRETGKRDENLADPINKPYLDETLSFHKLARAGIEQAMERAVEYANSYASDPQPWDRHSAGSGVL